MNQAPPIETSGPRAERTRAAILAAAEELFAKNGFAATRLEDVADTLRFTRAALFYYFRDKQALYDAMIADAFGPLGKQLEAVLAAPGLTAGQRIEASAEAWIDTIVARPTLARLILRFVADGAELHAHRLLPGDEKMVAAFWTLLQQGRRTGELKPVNDNPFHAASAVIGTTVFYVAALAPLVPESGKFEALDPEQVAAHKREIINNLRRLLGIRKRARKPAGKAPAAKRGR